MTRQRRPQYRETEEKIKDLLRSGRSKRVSKIREKVTCSPRTLYVVINDMIEKGLLIKDPKNKRNVKLRLSETGMRELSANITILNPMVEINNFEHNFLDYFVQNPQIIENTKDIEGIKKSLNDILQQLKKIKREGFI